MPYDPTWPWIESEDNGEADSDPPPLVRKATDLEALRDTVVDAAGISTALWLSYLFVLFYFLVAAGGVTHRDLLFENPVKLPFLNVDLPLLGFFALGPCLFLIVHAYVLIHFTLLADKIGVFHAELQRQVTDDNIRTQLRRQLPSNIFVQTLAGPNEVRAGILGFMLRQIAFITLVLAPIGLLVLFQLQFLAYHSVAITWWHRISVLVDIGLIWIFWPSISRGENIAAAWSIVRRKGGKVAAAAVGSLVLVALVFTVATYPGERLDSLPSVPLIPWKTDAGNWISLHKLLVAGDVDFSARRAKSFWSNRLVLPGIDVIDHSKYDSDEKIANMPSPILLRARHLEGAILTGATLRKVDFTGAWMQGASLSRSDVREAKFECDAVGQSGQNDRIFRCAQLQGASFVGSRLQAASFDGAQLDGALFYQASLQASSFVKAELNGAALDRAELQAATFDSAQLDGASLHGAQLHAVAFNSAHLHAASLDGAQLQGATLDGAEVDWASMTNIFAWRAGAGDVRSSKGILVSAVTEPQESCLGLDAILSSNSNCSWSADSFARLKQTILDQVPKGKLQQDALARIKRLDPGQRLDVDNKVGDTWTKFKASSPTLSDYENGKADQWREIGCKNPFILRGMINQLGFFDTPSAAQSKSAKKLADYFSQPNCLAARTLTEKELSTIKSFREKTAAGQ
jgi:uncharacterized protein YjbI with pentapeptide repeats